MTGGVEIKHGTVNVAAPLASARTRRLLGFGPYWIFLLLAITLILSVTQLGLYKYSFVPLENPVHNIVASVLNTCLENVIALRGSFLLEDEV